MADHLRTECKTDQVSTGRYAPSPTGDLHVGNLRTAILAWLFARHAGSPLLLRIDDLDPATSSTEHEDRQLADLAELGISFDGETLRQSDQFGHYEQTIAALEASGATYPCFCSRREIREAASAPHGHLPHGAYPGTCRDLSSAARADRSRERPAALRVRADAQDLTFVDDVHGERTVQVDDFVIRRNDGVPAYNLASVVDDAHQEIGQVVRGDDLLEGTARQIWLREVLGLAPVRHAHVPLMVNAEGNRLAKRDGAVTWAELRDNGHAIDELRAELAASVGQSADAAADSMETLLKVFDPAAIPTTPTPWLGLDRPASS